MPNSIIPSHPLRPLPFFLPPSLQRKMRPDRRRRQPPGHLPLDLELDPPPGTVARQQDCRVEFLEIPHRLRHLRLVERPNEVVATDDGVQRHRSTAVAVAARELEGVPRRVDHARVAAACEDDDAFAYSGHDNCQSILKVR